MKIKKVDKCKPNKAKKLNLTVNPTDEPIIKYAGSFPFYPEILEGKIDPELADYLDINLSQIVIHKKNGMYDIHDRKRRYHLYPYHNGIRIYQVFPPQPEKGSLFGWRYRYTPSTRQQILDRAIAYYGEKEIEKYSPSEIRTEMEHWGYTDIEQLKNHLGWRAVTRRLARLLAFFPPRRARLVAPGIREAIRADKEYIDLIYRGRRRRRRRRIAANPTLMCVELNPQEKINHLWKQAKKLKPNITRKEFLNAVNAHYQQHGTYPRDIELVQVPWTKGPKAVVCVGKIPEEQGIYYEPGDYTVKKGGGKYVYVHRPEGNKKTYLASVPDTGQLILVGSMKVHKDGWIHG